jgi:signal transduction histidine kinase
LHISHDHPDLLEKRPFPELGAALRGRVGHVLAVWMDLVRRTVPAASGLPDAELQDHVPVILARMADALEGARPEGLRASSPEQGLTRFRQNYGVQDVMAEDRLMRRVIVQQVEAGLGRRMTLAEQLALDGVIDEMLQGAVAAYVGEQHAQLRAAAEAELKYLSFLSHDLNNNLASVTLTLQVLKRRLGDAPEFADEVGTLDDAQRAVLDTIGGMGRLLQSERLRKAGAPGERRPVNLHDLLASAARLSSRAAKEKGIKIIVDAAPDAVAQTDRELIGLVVQNLVGNAVKYSDGGTVRVAADCAGGGCTVAVSDEGPGIAVEHLRHIFDAFARGAAAHGRPGVGLGLTIASQAARLLGAQLSVESTVGVGSTFRLAIPPPGRDAAGRRGPRPPQKP